MNFDWTILQWIQENLRCAALDFLMTKITMLGNSGMIWIAGVQHLLHLKSKSKILRPIEIMGFFYEFFCQIQGNNLL